MYMYKIFSTTEAEHRRNQLSHKLISSSQPVSRKTFHRFISQSLL